MINTLVKRKRNSTVDTMRMNVGAGGKTKKIEIF